MAHEFVFSLETETDHIFVCTICSAVIGFNKPGVGSPNAIVTEGDPLPPEDICHYVDPCFEENI